MTPREIHDVIAAGGAETRAAVDALAHLLDALSRGAVLSASGRAFRLPEGDRPGVVNDAWTRAVKLFKTGRLVGASDMALEVYLKKMLGSIAIEHSKTEATRGERFDTLDADAVDDRDAVEESADDTRAHWEKGIAAVAPIVAAYLEHTKSRDKKERIRECWTELQLRLVEKSSMREVLEARGLVTARTPALAVRKLAQARFMAHIRFREALARTLARMERERSISATDARTAAEVLKLLIRRYRRRGRGAPDA